MSVCTACYGVLCFLPHCVDCVLICVCLQAVWALGNIAGDSPQCRNLVLQAGALPPLLEQLGENQKVSMQRNATWTLSNFCRGKPPPDFTVVSSSQPLPAVEHVMPGLENSTVCPQLTQHRVCGFCNTGPT